MVLLLSPEDILNRGNSFLKVAHRNSASYLWKCHRFKEVYGASPAALSDCWEDLQFENIVVGEDASDEGFKMFMVANCFLYTYPKNARNLKLKFEHLPDRNTYGEPLWRWVRFIAAMKSTKIVWDPSLDDPETETFICSADAADFKTNELPFYGLSRCKQLSSNKFRSCGVKYEIACAVFQSKCLHIAGPFRAAKHDATIYEGVEDATDLLFRERLGLPPHGVCLQDKIKDGKLCITDRIYGSKPHVSAPNTSGSKELEKFKSRARCREESFNKRIKDYEVLTKIFHHSLTKHQPAMFAVCVMMQYQMENGAELFQV